MKQYQTPSLRRSDSGSFKLLTCFYLDKYFIPSINIRQLVLLVVQTVSGSSCPHVTECRSAVFGLTVSVHSDKA